MITLFTKDQEKIATKKPRKNTPPYTYTPTLTPFFIYSVTLLNKLYKYIFYYKKVTEFVKEWEWVFVGVQGFLKVCESW